MTKFGVNLVVILVLTFGLADLLAVAFCYPVKADKGRCYNRRLPIIGRYLFGTFVALGSLGMFGLSLFAMSGCSLLSLGGASLAALFLSAGLASYHKHIEPPRERILAMMREYSTGSGSFVQSIATVLGLIAGATAFAAIVGVVTLLVG